METDKQCTVAVPGMEGLLLCIVLWYSLIQDELEREYFSRFCCNLNLQVLGV